MNSEIGSSIETISFHDIDELAERMSAFRWNMVHQQIEAGNFGGKLLVARIGGIQFARLTYNRGLRSHGDSPPGTISIGVPLTRPLSLHWHGYSLTLEDALLQKSSSGIDFLRRGDFPLALVTINIDSLLRTAEITDRPEIASVVLDSTRAIRPDEKATERFRFSLQHLFAFVERNPAPFLTPGIETAIEQDFLSLSLDLLDSRSDRTPLRPAARHGYIKRAEELLLECPDLPLAIPDLCERLHISERTLRYGFQEYFGMSPAAYLKIHRLNGVRKQLKADAGEGATVSDIATRWGFWHMGQFAKDYKEMFGECPSETLRNNS
jgi:AraC family ethanolamine operon transcriptional activator